MFSKTISRLKEENKQLSDDNEVKGFRIKELSSKLDEKEKELDSVRHDNYKELRDVKKDFESKERILRNELGVEKQEAINTQMEINRELRQQNAVLLKEVEILNKAFENMGFDVKDMKGILDKLADALVSGNKVNIIK